MIRLARPEMTEDDIAAVAEVLRSGHLVQGPHVERFEAALAEQAGVEHCVAVTNCTAALQLSLQALGIGPGDLVAVTAYSWLSTANVIELCGAEPVFVDIDPLTFNMDPEALRATLRGRQVGAVLPVDAFGQLADLDAITSIAEAAGAVVVEDAACALGASSGGRRAGSWGAAGCFSFHPRKAITTGEGGAVATDDAELADELRSLRNHGQRVVEGRNEFVMAGFNCRMTEMQAALGTSQLTRHDRIVADRRELAATYAGLLVGSGVLTPAPKQPSSHVYQSYVVLLPEDLRDRNLEVIEALRSSGVEATIGTYHMPRTMHFRELGGHRAGDFPVADDVAGRAVSLPLWPGLARTDQELVVDRLLAAIEGVRA